jgi:hypothetical protein
VGIGLRSEWEAAAQRARAVGRNRAERGLRKVSDPKRSIPSNAPNMHGGLPGGSLFGIELTSMLLHPPDTSIGSVTDPL